MIKSVICALGILLPLCALAADKPGTAPKTASTPGLTKYSLFQDAVKFSAPSEWTVLLQKAEGMPQFLAFQVKGPDDQGGGEPARVSVEVRVLNDASTFQALVNAATDRAKQTPGFEQNADGTDATNLHYAGLDGKTRYEYRENWYLDSKIFIHVRCSRPTLATTSPAWIAAYEKGCAQVMQTIKPH